MTVDRKIAVLVGSLRKSSYSRRAIVALAAVAPKGFNLNVIEIGHLPLYN